MSKPHKNVFAGLLFVGAGFLLFRTIVLILHGALTEQVRWVAVLLVVESMLDVATLIACFEWWRRLGEPRVRIALRLAAAVTIVHAIRVLIFVLGRLEPWRDFEIRPEFRPLSEDRWSWGEVYFAAVMSTLSLCGVLIVWMLRRRGVNRNH